MPNARMQRRIDAAAKRFAKEIAQIVKEEAKGDLIAELREQLDAFDRKGKKRSRKRFARKAARSTRRAGKRRSVNYEKLVPKLVALMKKNGGEIPTWEGVRGVQAERGTTQELGPEGRWGEAREDHWEPAVYDVRAAIAHS